MHRPIAILLLALAGAASAAEVPPPFQAEQAWVYRQTATSTGAAPEDTRIEVMVAWEGDSDHWVIARRDLDPLRLAIAAPLARIAGDVDSHDCMVDVLAAQTLEERRCAPHAQGDEWGTSSRGAVTLREFKATGVETIRVPAGSFDALRVEAVESTQAFIGGSMTKTSTNSRAVYWYVPRLHAMARIERDVLEADGTVSRREVQVLEASGAASPAMKAALKTTPQWQERDRRQREPAILAAGVANQANVARPAVMTLSPDCKPEYPTRLFDTATSGTTRVRFVIGADGVVKASEVERASGKSREHHMLDTAARLALSKCRFTPARGRDGKPVEAAVSIDYAWHLD